MQNSVVFKVMSWDQSVTVQDFSALKKIAGTKRGTAEYFQSVQYTARARYIFIWINQTRLHEAAQTKKDRD